MSQEEEEVMRRQHWQNKSKDDHDVTMSHRARSSALTPPPLTEEPTDEFLKVTMSHDEMVQLAEVGRGASASPASEVQLHHYFSHSQKHPGEHGISFRQDGFQFGDHC